jgi:hypothetical protein
MWMDGWTDVIEFAVVLRNFANVPKKLKRQYTGARYTAFKCFTCIWPEDDPCGSKLDVTLINIKA